MDNLTQEAAETAALRLHGNRDFQTVMNWRLMQLNELILATPMQDGNTLSGALHSYHATKDLESFVQELARDAGGNNG